MGSLYAKLIFTETVRKLQTRYGSRMQYQRMAEQGPSDDELSARALEFIRARDSFYLASVGSNGWPYVQYRGGPKGFLRVLDAKTLAFADFTGNNQLISSGNLATNDRVSLFLMSYPEQARLKLIGHARIVELGEDAGLEAAVKVEGYTATVERVMVIDVVASDWACAQFITPRYTQEEMESGFGDDGMRGALLLKRKA